MPARTLAAAVGWRVMVGDGDRVDVSAAACTPVCSGAGVPLAGWLPPRMARERTMVARSRKTAPAASTQPGGLVRWL